MSNVFICIMVLDKIQVHCVSHSYLVILEVFIYETLSTAFTHLTLPFILRMNLKGQRTIS